MPQRFWFSSSFVRIPADIFDKTVYSFEDLFICLLPVKIVFPGLR
jgi:hypothetical protein